MSGVMMTPPAGGPAGTMPAPNAADPGADAGSDTNVLVTICKNDDGTYTVYSGDEPEEGESGDMSGDDVAAMGAEGDTAPPQGQQADSVGEALKMAMQILQDDESSAPGGPEAQFAGGFSGTPPGGPAGGAAPVAQKY